MELKKVVVGKEYVVAKRYDDGNLHLRATDTVVVRERFGDDYHRQNLMINIVNGAAMPQSYWSSSWYCNADILSPVGSDKEEDEDMVVCSQCGCKIEFWKRLTDDKGEIFCPDCYNELYTTCHECGEELLIEDAIESEDGDYYCGICYDEVFTRCCECGQEVEFGDAHRDSDGEYYCRSCWDDRCYNNGLRDYHQGQSNGGGIDYGMDYLYNGKRTDNPLMGVELEIDNPNCGDGDFLDTAEDAGDFHEILGENFIMSEDGSLSNGIEIVSCPATLEKHLELPWKRVMETALNKGYRSHDADTCGLHVHIDREFFSDTDDFVEYKFYILFRNNLEWIKRFSRRTNYGYCSINNRYSTGRTSYEDIDKYKAEDIEKIFTCHKHVYKGERHLAINFLNEETVEYRLFRGTLKYATFVATLQFVDMFAKFVKANTLKDIVDIDLSDFITMAKSEDYDEFLSYLVDRKIDTKNAEQDIENEDTELEAV